MSVRSGEQARRKSMQRAMTPSARYAQLLATRDKLRLVQCLRSMASRLEAEAKSENAQRLHVRGVDGPVAVTDHAVVRFLERVAGWDIPAVRQEIARAVPAGRMTPRDKGAGGHSIYVKDGFQFLLTPGSIISVLTADMDGQAWLEREELELLERL